MSSAAEAATDAAAASIVPVKQVRIDLVNLQYSPLVRDVKGKRHVKHVIHGVTTSFVPYTVSALMGPSGSGKTSLLTVVAGFVDRAHVKGEILVNGEGGNKPTPKKLVGIVFQVGLAPFAWVGWQLGTFRVPPRVGTFGSLNTK